MATNAIYNVNSIDAGDLTASSATMKYPVGASLPIKESGKAQPSGFLYVKAHAGFATVGTPFEITAGSSGNAEVVTKAVETLAHGAQIGFNTHVVTSGEYFWAQISGELTAASKAGVTAGDFVKVDNAEVDVETDGTTMTVNSIGMAKTSTASSAVTLAIVPNRTVTISV
jgi:hypothetical protein